MEETLKQNKNNSENAKFSLDIIWHNFFSNPIGEKAAM